MRATHMKKEEGKLSRRSRNGKIIYNLRKIQLQWSTTRQKAIYPIKKKKTIELLCSSWRSPLSLSHSSCSAGRRQQEGSVTPPPPPPSRDPCSRRPESGSNPQQRRGILGYLTKLATDKAQPTSRPAATSRAKIGFFSGGGITNPATSGSSQNRTTRESPPAGSAAAAALPATLVLSL